MIEDDHLNRERRRRPGPGSVLPAGRAGVEVTGVNIATNLIEQACMLAAAERLAVRFDKGDAEMLPYDEDRFDLAVSLIGAMFAPCPDLVAAELLRVCRPGGLVVMANWTAEGHVGQMFKIIDKHAPPPPHMESPLKWGNEAVVRDRLRQGTSSLNTMRMQYPMRYPFPPAGVATFFFNYYGPTRACPGRAGPRRPSRPAPRLAAAMDQQQPSRGRRHPDRRRISGGGGGAPMRAAFARRAGAEPRIRRSPAPNRA